MRGSTVPNSEGLNYTSSGKTKILRSLYKTYQMMSRRPVWQDLNPKAVTNDELFGFINPTTREWRDGRCGFIHLPKYSSQVGQQVGLLVAQVIHF